MRNLKYIIILIAAAFTNFSTPAGVFWDCSGNPPEPNLRFMDPKMLLYPDTPVKGVLFQDTYNLSSAALAIVEMSQSAATTELNYERGWFVEMGVLCVENAGWPTGFLETHGVNVSMSDARKTFGVDFFQNRIVVYDYNEQPLATYAYTTGPGYHKTRVQSLPGSLEVHVFVDDVFRGTVIATEDYRPQTPWLYFGDGASCSSGRAYWNYIAINQEPNSAPSASAAVRYSAPVAGKAVLLDGSESTDPEHQPLEYKWEIIAAPVGSQSTILEPTTCNSSFTPDAPGDYIVELTVTDSCGAWDSDRVTVRVVNAQDYVLSQVAQARDLLMSLPDSAVTSGGNRNALEQMLGQVARDVTNGMIEECSAKLAFFLSRTDGCVTRGEPDGHGPGRDWVLECEIQARLCEFGYSALLAL